MTRFNGVKNAFAALLIATGSLGATALAVYPDMAFANNGKGKNGGNNGNGNANANANRGNGNGAQNNGQGALARELRGFNAVNANQNALENAAPNSMPGMLYVYQQNHLSAANAEQDKLSAEQELARLAGLTEEQIAAEFPDGGYAEALEAAALRVTETDLLLEQALTVLETSMAALTGGEELSLEALTELFTLLGIE